MHSELEALIGAGAAPSELGGGVLQAAAESEAGGRGGKGGAEGARPRGGEFEGGGEAGGFSLGRLAAEAEEKLLASAEMLSRVEAARRRLEAEVGVWEAAAREGAEGLRQARAQVRFVGEGGARVEGLEVKAGERVRCGRRKGGARRCEG
jgi:hypothetical protein